MEFTGIIIADVYLRIGYIGPIYFVFINPNHFLCCRIIFIVAFLVSCKSYRISPIVVNYEAVQALANNSINPLESIMSLFVFILK